MMPDKRTRLSIVTMLAVMSVACTSYTQTIRPTQQRITVGVNADYPPYEFVTAEGQPRGFDIDVIRAASDAVHIEPLIQADQWSHLRARLEKGDIDLLAGMLYSEDRAKKVEFGAPYLEVDYSVFIRKSDMHIASIADLAGKSVLVEQGSQMHEQLKLIGNLRVIPVSSEPEAIRQLAKGTGDAALVPLLEGLHLAKSNSQFEIEAVGGPVYSRNLCFAAHKGNLALIGRLNTGLAIIKSNGKYSEIYDKWFGQTSPHLFPWGTIIIWLAAGCAFALISTVLGFAWVRTLRKQVNERTKALDKELSDRAAIESELRVSEEKYRSLVEQASDGIFVANEKFEIIDVNATGCSMAGRSREQIMGLNVSELFDPEHLQDNPLDLTSILSGQSTISERVAIRKDGSKIVVELSSKMIAPGVIQSIVRDVTKRREYEDQLLEVNEQLETRVNERTAELANAYRELETFSYSVAHDLRAPLRAMNGYATILLQENGRILDDDAKGYLDRISLNSKRMGILIDALLGYARMGRRPLQLAEIDLAKIAKAVWEELETERSDHDISLHVDDVPMVIADEMLMKLVLQNLLQNAIKFSNSRGHSTVEFGYDSDRNAFYVKDEGVGFDPKYADRLFRVFERLHVEEFDGTGIGLATVKRIIERHGGTVGAEGRPERGAMFWFMLDQGVNDLNGDSSSPNMSEVLGA